MTLKLAVSRIRRHSLTGLSFDRLNQFQVIPLACTLCTRNIPKFSATVDVWYWVNQVCRCVKRDESEVQRWMHIVNCIYSSMSDLLSHERAHTHTHDYRLLSRWFCWLLSWYLLSNFSKREVLGINDMLISALYQLFVCLLNFLSHFLSSLLLSLCFLPYLFTSILVYFSTSLSTINRIGLFRFLARGRRRRPNLALVFLC